jgi:predicted short-subunit dehydrogenase-like oxidoreductase (DUF2520 family)
MARRLARTLRGHVIEVPPEFRELYHATCVVASNHLSVLLSAVREMYGRVCGDPQPSLETFRPIVEATILNVFATSPAAALSGPVARGGVETVAKHLEAVRGSLPELLPYFTRMTLETIRLAIAGGALTPERREALENLVMSYTHEPPTIGNRQ